MARLVELNILWTRILCNGTNSNLMRSYSFARLELIIPAGIRYHRQFPFLSICTHEGAKQYMYMKNWK